MARRTPKASHNPRLKRAKAGPSQESLGSEIVGRLNRFVKSLESLPPAAPLDKRFTVRTVKLNLPRPSCTPEDVRVTRDMLGASQAIFAQFLGVSASAVQDWEQGHKPPRGSACRLMQEIRRDPKYWSRRLAELMRRETD
jgi:putative transcriptional regulator